MPAPMAVPNRLIIQPLSNRVHFIDVAVGGASGGSGLGSSSSAGSASALLRDIVVSCVVVVSSALCPGDSEPATGSLLVLAQHVGAGASHGQNCGIQ